MAKTGELVDLRRDMSFMKHQIASIMQALKIDSCACHDCIVTPSLIQSSNEIVVDFKENSNANTRRPLSTPSRVEKTNSSHNADQISEQTQEDEKLGENIFDNVSQMNTTNNEDITNPDDKEEISPNGEIEHNYGKAQSGGLKRDATASALSEPPEKMLKVTEEDCAADAPAEPVVPKKRGRKPKNNSLYVLGNSAVKLDKLGRRFYTEEQKSAMYQCFNEKGLQETAELFNTSTTSVCNHVFRYKSKLQTEEAKSKLLFSARTIRRARESKKTKMFSIDVIGGKSYTAPRIAPPTATSTPTTKIKNVDSKDSSVETTPKKADTSKTVTSGKNGKTKRVMRYFDPETKKNICNYCASNGRAATMQHFQLTENVLNYLMYAPNNLKYRQSVNNALDDNNILQISSESDAVMPSAEGSMVNEEHEVKLEVKALQKDISGLEKEETETETGQNVLIPSSVSADAEEACNNNNANGDADIVKANERIGGRKKILTEEQEDQLYLVLSTLESQGTRITASLLSYAAKQIIKRSSNVPIEEIRMSYSYAIHALAKYRERVMNTSNGV